MRTSTLPILLTLLATGVLHSEEPAAGKYRQHTPPANTHPLMQRQAEFDLPSLLVDAQGQPITTPEQWQQRRSELLRDWTQILGKLQPAPEDEQWFGDVSQVVIKEDTQKEGYRRIHLQIPLEKDFLQEHLLLLPTGQGEGPFPAVIAWTSTSPDYTEPETLWGAWLARRGFVVLTSWSFIRHYRDNTSFRNQVEQKVYDRFGRWAPLGKMVHDVQREVAYLKTRPEVDASRIGFMGFSLSAKTALYVAAFAPEVTAVVSVDPHLAIHGATNYGSPWYLDWQRQFPDIQTPDYPDPQLRGTVWSLLDIDPQRPGFEHDHHELLALAAPRAVLVIGCSSHEKTAVHSDDQQSLAYYLRAKEIYDLLNLSDRLELFMTDEGHRGSSPKMDPIWQRFLVKWLQEQPLNSPRKD